MAKRKIKGDLLAKIQEDVRKNLDPAKGQIPRAQRKKLVDLIASKFGVHHRSVNHVAQDIFGVTRKMPLRGSKPKQMNISEVKPETRKTPVVTVPMPRKPVNTENRLQEDGFIRVDNIPTPKNIPEETEIHRMPSATEEKGTSALKSAFAKITAEILKEGKRRAKEGRHSSEYYEAWFDCVEAIEEELSSDK